MKRTWRLRLTGFLRIPCSNQFLRQPIPRDNQYCATTIACDNHRVRQPIPCENQFLATTNSLRQPIPCDNQFLATTNSLRLPSCATTIACDYQFLRYPWGPELEFGPPHPLVYRKRRENGATCLPRDASCVGG